MSFDPVSYAMGQQAGGGGGGVTVEPLSVTENGTYTAPSNKAYSPVTVEVPNTYTVSDEGKVVSSGALVAQTAHATVTQNGAVDTTLNNSVEVAVPLNVGIVSVASSLSNAMSGRTIDPPIERLTYRNTYGSGTIMSNHAFNNFGGASVIEFTVDRPVSTVESAFQNVIAESIILNLDFSNCTNFRYMFNHSLLKPVEIAVTGTTLDLSAATSAANIYGLVGANIKEIRFVPSSCKYSWENGSCRKASDDTLVSMANALDGMVTGQTLTLYSEKKTRCGQIVGTVTDGVFTIDAGGSTALTDFITLTKGWTLA